MIILRQKIYSRGTTQALFKIKKAANGAMVALDNAGLKAGQAVKRVLTGKETPSVAGGFKRKSDRALMREALQTERGVRGNVNQAILDPYKTAGKALNENLIQPTMKAPVGTIVTNVLPVPGTYETFLALNGPAREAQMWDRVGAGKIFKPAREAFQRNVTTPRISGALQGINQGLRAAII